jgi:transcriptional regulator with XRE-family HTH domain
MSTTALLKTNLTIQTQSFLFGEKAVSKTNAPESIGSRIARLRKDKGMTQLELAERMGVSQPVISDYENDEIGLDSARIVQLAQILDVSGDEVLGLQKPARTSDTIKNRRLYRQIQSIDKLPKRDQQALLRTIDAFLSKAV